MGTWPLPSAGPQGWGGGSGDRIWDRTLGWPLRDTSGQGRPQRAQSSHFCHLSLPSGSSKTVFVGGEGSRESPCSREWTWTVPLPLPGTTLGSTWRSTGHQRGVRPAKAVCLENPGSSRPCPLLLPDFGKKAVSHILMHQGL